MSKVISTKKVRHDLAGLVGKTIKSIIMTEVSANDGDTDDVRQYYHITFSDDAKTVLACDGNNSSQYATACLIDQREYDDLFEVENDDELD